MKISATFPSEIMKKERFVKDKTLLFSFIVIAAGLIGGTIMFAFTNGLLGNEIPDLFSDYFAALSYKTKTEVFTGMLITNLPYIILMIVSGSSAYGTVLIAILSFVKVSGLGILSSYFYSCYALKGIEYSLLVFFPGKFILILSVLFMMHICINNSLQINKLIKGEWKTENSSLHYSVKVVTAVILFVISALIDCFMTVSFSSLFSF